MRKTILFLTTLILAGCGSQRETPYDNKSNNDSPIVVGDTSIPILKAPDKDETKIWHKAAPGNNDQHHHANADGHFYFHDKENGKDYQAACFVFASQPTPPILIDPTATSWEISFETVSGPPLSLRWANEKAGVEEKGDITVVANGATEDKTDPTKVLFGAKVAKMKWRIGSGSFSQPISPPIDPKDRDRVTIHYCAVGPNGPKCELDGKDPCHP